MSETPLLPQLGTLTRLNRGLACAAIIAKRNGGGGDGWMGELLTIYDATNQV